MEQSNKTIEFFRKQIGAGNVRIPSPAGTWLAPTLRAIDYGMMELEFKVRKEMLNPAKLLHGGMISLMFDDAIGATVYCLEKETSFVTVNLNVNFLTIARLDDIVLVKTKVIRSGRTTVNVEAEMWNGSHLMATASSVLVSTGKPKTIADS